MTKVSLTWASRTDSGLRRTVNEDALIAEYPVFLVADGMGGHNSGDIASVRALDAFRPLLGRDAVSMDEIESAFRSAVLHVRSIATDGTCPGTTISGVAVSEQGGSTYWLVINIGDSRTYRLARGSFEQISVDHSAVQELIDLGQISASDAHTHPDRSVITRAVGAGSGAEPDYWLLPANAGDRLLICSDGLSKELDKTHIEAALRDENAPVAAVDRLVHEALLHGGNDNVTVIVIDARVVLDQDAAIPGAAGAADEEASRASLRAQPPDHGSTIRSPNYEPAEVQILDENEGRRAEV